METHKIRDEFLYIACFLWLLVAIGCGDNKKQEHFQAPLCLGLLYDVSQSTEKQSVPILNNAHIQRAIAILEKRGGVMAFGWVGEPNIESLERLSLTPVTGRLDERAQRHAKNQEKIRQFQSKVEAKINRPRNGPISLIQVVVERFTLFFGEATIPHNAEKVLICVSDGIDESRCNSSGRLPDGVKVFAIGMENNLAQKLFGERVSFFESIDAALEALDTTPGGGSS